MALSMEEQRILAEMERNLAAEDPRLASRLSSFGQQRAPGTLRSQRVRTIAGLLALAMIAAVTVTMFMLSPYVNGRHGDLFPRTHSTAGTKSPKLTTSQHPNSGKSNSSASDTKSGKAGGAKSTGARPPSTTKSSATKSSATKSSATKSSVKTSATRAGSLDTASKAAASKAAASGHPGS